MDKADNQKNPHLSVIIPAYNEAKRIGKTLDRVQEYLFAQDYTWEVLVVIDGAIDNTAEVAKGYKESFNGKLRVIDNKKNHGKGYVVRQGMLEARGEYRVFTDADNSTDIHYLEDMLAKFKEGLPPARVGGAQAGHDVVISTREERDAKGAGQTVSQSGLKQLLGNMGNLFIQLVAVPGIWDTQNGFKGFTAEAAEDIFSRMRIDGFAFDIEALALARHLGYRIGIIPIMWKNDPNSHVSATSYIEVLFDTIKIRWNILRGVYDK